MNTSPAFRYAPLREGPQPAPEPIFSPFEQTLIAMMAHVYRLASSDRAHPVVKSIAGATIREYAHDCLEWIVQVRNSAHEAEPAAEPVSEEISLERYLSGR